MTRIHSSFVGDGSGAPGIFIGRAGSENIPAAVTSLPVVFSSDLTTTAYTLTVSITNTTDADPIMLQVVDVVKASTGFTALFNAATDSANYVLEYAAVLHV